MRLLLVITILLVGAVPSVLGAEARRLDVSKEYSYVLPDDWQVLAGSGAPHDVLVLTAADGKSRNIVVRNQPGKSLLAELKGKYERDLPKALKDFQLIDSAIVDVRDERQAIRITHTNTAPGVPVRQINYVLEVGPKRYFVACTVLKADGDQHDAVFDAFVKSLEQPQE